MKIKNLIRVVATSLDRWLRFGSCRHNAPAPPPEQLDLGLDQLILNHASADSAPCIGGCRGVHAGRREVDRLTGFYGALYDALHSIG